MSEHAHRTIDRRRFLQQGAAAAASLAAAAPAAPSQDKPGKPVRIGVIGLGPRGTYLLRSLVSYFPEVVIPSLCDLKPDRLQAGIELVKKIRGVAPAGYGKGEHDYRNMAQRHDLDGILVATGVQVFGQIAVDAMKAGKNVATEVTGPHTLEDCWAIVEEKERSGKHYMLLEQCVYGDENLMILNMIKQGLFCLGSTENGRSRIRG